jgi:predicted nucleic acid-binding protein
MTLDVICWSRCAVRSSLLLDTGALVSLLDRSQRAHREFVSFFEQWAGRVISTEAVLTEATHLLGRVHRGADACLDFFLCGGATLVPLNLQALMRCRDLMEMYADLPMDFADATLVTLAEELETDLVLTTDRRDFSVYRLRSGRAFTVLP